MIMIKYGYMDVVLGSSWYFLLFGMIERQKTEWIVKAHHSYLNCRYHMAKANETLIVFSRFGFTAWAKSAPGDVTRS